MCLTVILSVCGSVRAATPGEKAPRPFGFAGPEMYKLSWATNAVAIGDVNGDGLNDICVPENAFARIQCLIQRRPPFQRVYDGKPAPNELADDARFEKRRYLAGKRVYSLALGDLNGDGRKDMVFYGDPPELVVVYQNKEGKWGNKRGFDIRDGSKRPFTLTCADFNGDKRDDICLLCEDSTCFIYQVEDGSLGRPVKYPGIPQGVFALSAGDYDGDGRLDLLYSAGKETMPFSFRLQDRRGRMSPEIPFKKPTIRAMITGDIDGETGDEVLCLEERTRRMVVYKLYRGKPAEGLLKGQIRRYPLPAAGSGQRRAMAMADLDGDGRLDALMTDPKNAQIDWFRQDADGALLRPRGFPSLQNAADIQVADLDGDGTPEILVLSPDESALGLTRRTESGRIAFPSRIALKGKPTAFAVGDLDGDGKAEVVCAVTESYKRRLVGLKFRGGKRFETTFDIPLAKAQSDVSALVVADANQDGKADLLIFQPYKGMEILTQRKGGKFEPVSGAGYGKGLAGKFDRDHLSLGDVTGDGKAELLVARDNFARAMRLDSDGQLQVVEQFNGRSSSSRIQAAAVADLDGDKVAEIVLLDAANKCLSILRKGKSGAYAIVENRDIGDIDGPRMSILDFDGDGASDVLIFGRNKLVAIQSRAPRYELRQIADYESRDRRDIFGDVAVGDLNGDGRPDVVLSETHRNALQFLTFDPAKRRFTARAKFQIFEKKSFRRESRGGGRGTALRVIEIADVTGDKKNDLLLLIHDRLNVYPQE